MMPSNLSLDDWFVKSKVVRSSVSEYIGNIAYDRRVCTRGVEEVVLDEAAY